MKAISQPLAQHLIDPFNMKTAWCCQVQQFSHTCDYESMRELRAISSLKLTILYCQYDHLL